MVVEIFLRAIATSSEVCAGTYVTVDIVSNIATLLEPSSRRGLESDHPRGRQSMRRVLLITAGLTALSCAHRTGAPEEGAPTQGAAELSVIPEFQPQPGEKPTSYEVDRNGKPDLWRSTRVEAEGKELLLRKAKDLDGDGRIDCWEAYGPDGTLSKLVYDLDFDGAPDAILTFEKDQLVKKEYAFGFDGQSRSWSYFEKGKLVRKERDTSGDGRV